LSVIVQVRRQKGKHKVDLATDVMAENDVKNVIALAQQVT
jgi:hypothetical protein